eukprot:1426715-Prymnesium_polylepis.1
MVRVLGRFEVTYSKTAFVRSFKANLILVVRLEAVHAQLDLLDFDVLHPISPDELGGVSLSCFVHWIVSMWSDVIYDRRLHWRLC